MLERFSISSGHRGTASDGSGRNVCIIEFQFERDPAVSTYQIAVVGAGETDPCRACILGIITPHERAEPVFILDW